MLFYFFYYFVCISHDELIIFIILAHTIENQGFDIDFKSWFSSYIIPDQIIMKIKEKKTNFGRDWIEINEISFLFFPSRMTVHI